MGETIIIPGEIDRDGTLRLNMVELREKCKAHKDCKVSIQIEVFNDGDTSKMLSWYRNHALPLIVKAFRETGEMYSDEVADEKMAELTTARKKTAGGTTILLKVESLDRPMLIRYLDEVNIVCSTNLNLIL